jgi:hypothetical protein
MATRAMKPEQLEDERLHGPALASITEESTITPTS